MRVIPRDKSGAPKFPIDRINLVNGCPVLSASEKAILSQVALKHNASRGYAFASTEYLAQQTGFSTRTVGRAFQRLESEGLIQRSYRDNDPSQSKKTVVNWDRLRDLVVVNEPWDGKKVKKETATTTLEEDQSVVDTLDTPTGSPAMLSTARRNDGDVAQESMALLRKHFAGHVTFKAKDAKKMMFKSIWGSIKEADSAEQCLAVFEWVCNDPANEGKRDNLHASEKLGGYIKYCFKGWLREFNEADQVNYPKYENSLNKLCDGTDNLHFSEENLPSLQPFRAWLEAKVGEHLLDLEIITDDDDGTYLRVEIDDEFKAARLSELLEFQDSEEPNSLVDEEYDE